MLTCSHVLFRVSLPASFFLTQSPDRTSLARSRLQARSESKVHRVGTPPEAGTSMGLIELKVMLSQIAARQGAVAFNWLKDYVPPVAEEAHEIHEAPPAAIAKVAEPWRDINGAALAQPPAEENMARGALGKVRDAMEVVRAWMLYAPLPAFCTVLVLILGLGFGLGIWASSPGRMMMTMPLESCRWRGGTLNWNHEVRRETSHRCTHTHTQ